MLIKLAPTRAGLPDGILLAPAGRMVFVELKTSTGRVSPIQKFMHRALLELGFPVTIVRSRADLLAVLDTLSCDP
jgi:hypothetical protein